jgi:hypothetical protein
MRGSGVRRQVLPASWFAELCEGGRHGRKARREAAHGAKADKPKRYEPLPRLQDPGPCCRTFAPGPGERQTAMNLYSRCRARMLDQ